MARPLTPDLNALLRSIVWAIFISHYSTCSQRIRMDGGRVLRAFFCRQMDMVQATQRAVRIGHVFSTLFMMVGILTTNWWLVMIGFFLLVRRATGRALSGVSIRAAERSPWKK